MNCNFVISFDYKTTCKKSKGIIAHYPLNVHFMTLNVIKDNCTSINDITVGGSETWNFDKIRMINYSNAVDLIAVSGNANNYATALGGGATTAACDANCERCFNGNANMCYVCKPTFVLRDNQCFPSNGFFLKSPTSHDGDIPLTQKSIPNPYYTLTWFMKIYGFTQAPTDVIEFGSTAKIFFDDQISNTDTYGLSLMTQTNTVISNKSDFRDLIGRWVFVGISYYYDMSKVNTYPSMIQWQINNKMQKTLTQVDGLNFNKITIKRKVQGLFTKFQYWNEFIVGPYGHVLNTTSITGVSPTYTMLEPKTSALQVQHHQDPDFDVYTGYISYVQDRDFFFDNAGSLQKCTGANDHFNYDYVDQTPATICETNGTTGCRTQYYGAGPTECTCYRQNGNGKKEMIFEGSGVNFCYRD